MNQGRIWCVVNPTVGLPLLLGSVAVTSLIVHFSVLSNTDWFANYWKGASKAKAAAMETTTKPVALGTSGAPPGVVFSVAPVAGKSASGETSFVITIGAKPAATAQTENGSVASSDTLAMAPAGK